MFQQIISKTRVEKIVEIAEVEVDLGAILKGNNKLCLTREIETNHLKFQIKLTS